MFIEDLCFKSLNKKYHKDLIFHRDLISFIFIADLY